MCAKQWPSSRSPRSLIRRTSPPPCTCGLCLSALSCRYPPRSEHSAESVPGAPAGPLPSSPTGAAPTAVCAARAACAHTPGPQPSRPARPGETRQLFAAPSIQQISFAGLRQPNGVARLRSMMGVHVRIQWHMATQTLKNRPALCRLCASVGPSEEPIATKARAYLR
jgi:hypothetical protein